MDGDDQTSKRRPSYDVTECVICADSYKDPRQLPCLHTFCLTCLQSWGRDTPPADTLTCPVCRRQFQFSDAGGLAALPKDRFVAKMLMFRRLTSQVASRVQCNQCCEWTLIALSS